MVPIYKTDYASEYQYRKAIRQYRQSGYVIAKVTGGIMCFKSTYEYETWKRQK